MDAGVTWERVDGIYLAQNSDQSSDVLGTAMNIQGLQNAPQFLTGCMSISVSRGAVLHGISVDKKNQLDVTFCILYFSSNSCSTCFGQPCAHHQELTTA